MSDIRFRLAGAFGDFRLDAEATLPASGVTALVGPSGSGKTTLLRCLAGLARAEGEVAVGEAVWQDARRFVPTWRRGVGYVFQEPSLLPHLSVKGNLDYAIKRAGERPGPAFDDVVAMLGLAALLHRSPEALSGGERQRAAIGRALLAKPALLLMDEPLSSLDAASKAEVLPYLEQLHRGLSLPVIYVSHDALEVARLADRVVRMAGGTLVAAHEAAPGDPLANLSDGQVRTLARAALAAGLEIAS
ncbi:MAG: molybdate transporter, ATP-binding protein [Phenylobacterium sp.]|jgi:molybdate transport system ATP-binding protein|nr:molybdate transporter, ATP-binding protein [Phenylobacterium sp.]